MRARSAAVLLCAAFGSAVVLRAETRPQGVGTATFVGAAVCARCHAGEAAAWTGSHHQRAMQAASPATVLGDFADARFEYAGVTSTFSRRGDRYAVRTDGADGALHDYEVAFTLGVAPLQQYLVPFPGGRLQALAIAWDTRPAADGGQRWISLYPDDRVAAGDPLHWTGVTLSWNYMCADCHSTDVRKGWSAEEGTYTTTFAEPSVSCEACHGPGSRHVAWADGGDVENTGLSIALDERDGVTWGRDPTTHLPTRSVPRTSDREIETCARCHARRGLQHEDSVHGQPAGDDYRIALLDADLYWPDGQIKAEVYEYGSFLQSRMYAAGVTCSDCHDPHTATLRAPGEALCLQCHDPTLASPRHHFHDDASAGARCVACHMPATTYMVVDDRRDHGLRVPRPDLSVELGVPNPCNQCHADRTATWAARTVEGWYGHTPSGSQQFAHALAAADAGAPGATIGLTALAADHSQPAIARASAIARLRGRLAQPAVGAAAEGLRDPSYLVRQAAVRTLADLEPSARTALIAPLLADPVRTVRMEAATALAGAPAADPGPRDRATAEYRAALDLGSDRPEAQLALAVLRAREQDFAGAEAALRRARALDPSFSPAAVNLADLYRVLGRDDDAERVLRESLARSPDQPAVLHALGLVLVRQRRTSEALEALGAAARLDPGNPRDGYVYAVALHDAGRAEDAVRTLEEVVGRHPYDRDSLAALVAYHREAGDAAAAEAFARRVEALDVQ